MTRRDLIALLGTTAVSWPLGAHAQQHERVRRVGVLTNLAEDDPESKARIAAFLKGLQQLGWTDGQNVQIDYRWAAGDAARIRREVSELLALVPDIILVTGTAATGPLLQATQTVPTGFRAGPRSGRRRICCEPRAAGGETPPGSLCTTTD